MVEITERDKKIFNILFKLRYMTPKQLSLYLNCPVYCVYERAEKLIREGYLESTRIKAINERVYSNGSLIRRDHKITAYRKKVLINDDTTEKYLLLNDIYLHLVNKLGINEGDITAERDIRWKKPGLNSEKKTMIPSFVVRKGKHLVAIKLEKSLKKQDILRDVFKNYSFYTDFYSVKYLCTTKEIKNGILKIVKKDGRTFIKVYLVKDFFDGENLGLC